MLMILFLFFFAFFNQSSPCQASLNSIIEPIIFSFPSFDNNSCSNGTLICMGSVTGGNGYLSLTPELQQGNSSTPSSQPLNKVGRVLFQQPVLAYPAAISTTFTVRISTFPDAIGSGDGMAFILAEDNDPSPPESFGLYLGIMDRSTEGGVVRQLAVELDTYKNEFDPDENHIGIDTISMRNPVTAKSLNDTGIELKSGKDVDVRIDYDSLTKVLQISVAYSGNPLVSFLNQSIDIFHTVSRTVYVGFTASTGTLAESHQVLNWKFTSVPLPYINNGPGKDYKIKTILLIIVIPIVVGLLIVAICTFLLLRIRRDLRKKQKRTNKRPDIESRSLEAANAPKMFTFRELSKATHNFSRENLLGTGGFGSVYKGTILDPPTTIAVKKISATSNQGEKEFLAEICTIGRLRHRNIVQLQGWCHEGAHLLLVYEYMANGSLDRFIGLIFLEWKKRYKILTGLASALLYLHEECGSPVVHRDVKPNNVMLDADFNAHLGDFGLARLLRNESSVTTMLAGTPGYLAPEVGFTGKATPESDVYSFGMVVIEVVSGRRSKGIMEENSLVDYIWSLYGKNALIEGVDRNLEGKFDEEQVKRTLTVGLACLHPDSMFRPSIRKVVQVFLNPNEPLMMNLPESRPNAVYISVSSASSSTCASSKTTSDMGSENVNALSSLEEIQQD